MKRIVLRMLLFFGSLAFALVAAEVGFRVLYPDDGEAAQFIIPMQEMFRRGELSTIEPHPFLSFTRARSLPNVNALGFIGPEIVHKARPGTRRIALIGGSTTESYRHHMQEVLDLVAAEPTEVLGFGVSGWSTAESAVNFCLNVQHFKPDAVVIHHAVNDLGARLRGGYRTDYAHWRVQFSVQIPWWRRTLGSWSQLYAYFCWKLGVREYSTEITERHPYVMNLTPDGKLRPETTLAYRQNLLTMITLANAIGSRPFLMTMPYRGALAAKRYGYHVQAIVEHNAIMRELAADPDVRCGLIDLAAKVRGHDEYFFDLVHFKYDARYKKAYFVAEALWREGVLRSRFDRKPAPPPR